LAGCGKGEDAAGLGETGRLRWRRQALTWLEADLRTWRRLLENEPAKAAPAVAKTMRHWLADADFAGVRGTESLAKIPEGERQAWDKLWAGVADLLARAKEPPPPEVKEKPGES
jgi:hypothetical protein